MVSYNYTVEKGRDVFRIIILGDSFVEGLYVNSSNKFTEVLEDELNIFCKNKKAEVLNLGVSGYDISYMVERFKKRGIKYNPDLVLVWVKRDDFDVINDIYIPLFHYYLEKYRTGYYDSDHYANRVAADHYSTIINNYSYNKPLEDSILFPLSEIVNTTKYIGSKLIFFTHHGGVSSGYFGNYDTIVNNLLGGKNTFYYKMNIDAKDWEYKYSIIPPGSIEYDRSISDSHPNESGHFIIAKKLFQFLSENNFLAC